MCKCSGLKTFKKTFNFCHYRVDHCGSDWKSMARSMWTQFDFDLPNMPRKAGGTCANSFHAVHRSRRMESFA
jgi:hypothetical protein